MCNKILFSGLLLVVAFHVSAQNTMKVQSGATIKTTGGAVITLQDMNLDNDGTINQAVGDGGFRFSGSADNTIGGTAVPLIDILQIAKSGTAKLSLLQNFDILSSINFTSGLIDLNNKNIKLAPSALLNGEWENSRIIGAAGGFVEISATLNNPSLVNPGNLGATITSSANMGSTIIRRGNSSQTNSGGGGSSILRYYDIIPANNTGLNATLNFSYFDNELNGLSESQLSLWKSTDNIHWIDQGFDRKSIVTNYVEKSSIADFSRWTLSTIGSTLPLQFVLFNVKCEGSRVVLNWKTAQEINTGSFEIQRSNNGINWTTIGVVQAAGNSSAGQNYSYIDSNPLTGNVMYRVAEIDLDGHIHYTGIIRSECGGTDFWKVWPNPVQEQLFINVSSFARATVMIKIVDAKGSLVKKQVNELLAGNNQLTVDMRHLLPGVYNVSIEWADGQSRKTFIVIKH